VTVACDDRSLTRAITRLMREMPGTTATDQERAAWFDCKAEVFEQIAANNAWQAEEATALAVKARAEAAQLRRDGSR
jgi:hypothetical protein